MRKNYLYNLGLTVFNLAVPVVVFPVVARALGPAEVGKAQFIFIFCQYLAILAALGIPVYGAREVAKLRGDATALRTLLRELITVNALTGTLIFLGLCAATFWVPLLEASRAAYIGAGLMVLLSFSSVEWIYNGLEGFKNLALRSVVVKCAYLILALLLVRSRGDAPVYLALTVGSVIAYNTLQFAGVWRHLAGRVQGFNPGRHWRPLVFVLGTTIASTLYTTFDSVLLGLLAGDTAVGLYTAATKIAKMLLPVIMAFGAVSLPRITAAVRDAQHADWLSALDRSHAYVVDLGVPLAVGLFVVAPSLVEVFSGSEFGAAVRTLRILALLPLVIGLGYFWGYQVALPLGMERALMTAALAGVAVSLALNFWLVPRVQQDGAAIAGIAAEGVVTLAYWLQVRGKHPFKAPLRRWAAALLCSAPIAVFLFVPDDFLLGSEWMSLAATAAACAALYAAGQLYVFHHPVLRGALRRLPLVPQPGASAE